MQIVFYKEIQKKRELTPNEKIIYSFLLYKSLAMIDHAFDTDGNNLNIENIKEEISDTNYISMYEISYRNLAKSLYISPRSTILVLKSLRDKNTIVDSNIYVSLDIIDGGYYYLDMDKGLKGELLIFYSFLKNKSEYWGGKIDTYKSKIAEEFGVTKIAVTNLLNRLYNKCLVERTEDNKLKIN